MTNEKLYEAIGDINEKYIKEAKQMKKDPKITWLKLGTMAACLFLIITIVIPFIPYNSVESPNAEMDPSIGPSNLVVSGITFFISPHLAVSYELPDGFTYAGEADIGGFEDCSYYVNSNIPEWIYVYHEVMTGGTVDSTGTLTRTDPHNAYARYVDERLRGKDLVSYNGDYFISMWSAQCYGDNPDVSKEYFASMESAYGIRLEGDAPDGFVSVGIAEFSGNDTIPHGILSSNQGAHEVFVNPNEPDVILVSTQWHTASLGENGETRHEGFNVYIRYDCPLT